MIASGPGSVDVAAAAPARVGADVVDVARNAFVHGLRVGALTAAGLAALLTLLTGFSLRGRRRAPVPEPAAAPPS